MIRRIAIIVLVTFIPVQVYAGIGLELDPVEKELLRIKPPIIQQELPDRTVGDRLMERPPKTTAEGKSGTNWWLWGGVGVAAVIGGALALASGSKGGGGSSSTNSGSVSSTTTVTGSW